MPLVLRIEVLMSEINRFSIVWPLSGTETEGWRGDVSIIGDVTDII